MGVAGIVHPKSPTLTPQPQTRKQGSCRRSCTRRSTRSPSAPRASSKLRSLPSPIQTKFLTRPPLKQRSSTDPPRNGPPRPTPLETEVLSPEPPASARRVHSTSLVPPHRGALEGPRTACPSPCPLASLLPFCSVARSAVPERAAPHSQRSSPRRTACGWT